ncbi:extracellular solute-binding protein [bacterium]|nr:extracellular solute-binding protein [bacterium]
MSLWKVALISAVLVTLLWFLAPSRSEQVSEPGVVEITYMGPGGPLTSPMEDAVREFEALSRAAHAHDPAHPVYRVVSGQNASRNQTEDPTRFLVSLAGGMPPDVIYFDRYAVTEWAHRGAFQKLDGFIARDRAAARADAIRPEDYFDSCWDEVVYRNPVTGERGVYGIPEKVDNRALFYNKDLLQRAGYVDDQGAARPPHTWEELEQMAAKLTERDARGRVTRMGFVPNFGNSWLYLYGWMNGGHYISTDGRRCVLNEPRVTEALTWMTRMYDALGGAQQVYAFQSSFQGGDLDPFITGRVAMKIDGFWMITDSVAQFGQNLNYGIARPPIPASQLAAGSKVCSWVSGWCYAIPATAKNKEAAWELIRFLSSPRAYEIMAESQRLTLLSQGRVFVPTQNANRKINRWLFDKYVINNPSMDPKVAAAVNVFNDLLAGQPYRPVTPVGQLLWNQHIEATENAIFHKLSPQAALDRATMIVQRDLDRALAPPRGTPVSWNWFFVLYGVLLVGVALGVYCWDTKPALRGALVRGRAKLLGAGSRPPHPSPRTTAGPASPPSGRGDSAAVPHSPPGERVGVRGQVAAPKAAAVEVAALEGLQSSYFRSQWRGGWICALPWIVGFVVFTGGPILFSIIISFCEFDILNPARFTGLANYGWMFTRDALFWKSLWNTVYMVIGIPLGMAMSLGIALLLTLKVRGVAVWRTMFYLPSIVPAVASSILWIWIFNPNAGLLNTVLAAFGIHGPNWLQDENTSKLSLILMGLWGAGGGMVIWIAGLKGISESYYEAAAIDGANIWQKFTRITLPLLSPYIFFNLIMALIGTFQIFTQAFIMTQGGPVNSTLFYAYHLFNNAFRYLQMGYAAAMAWFLFLIVFGLTLVQMKLSQRWVHYEEG